MHPDTFPAQRRTCCRRSSPTSSAIRFVCELGSGNVLATWPESAGQPWSAGPRHHQMGPGLNPLAPELIAEASPPASGSPADIAAPYKQCSRSSWNSLAYRIGELHSPPQPRRPRR